MQQSAFVRLGSARRLVAIGSIMRSAVFVFATLIFCATPSATTARQTIVIGNDRGGSVEDRVRLIQKYATTGISVEIRGDFCLSACTMYLKLANTCVTPTTLFGFHGPSSRIYGLALNSAAFEHWSGIMADHYPEPLRDWFMNEGRHRIVGFHEISGQDLIQIGVSRC